MQYDSIIKEILACRICPQGKIGVCVPGEGSISPQIVFVGEAPGKTEAKEGRPFIGRSGKLLRSLISTINVADKDIYITSVVKYLPVKGTPSLQEIVHGKIHLMKQLEFLSPSITVLLGKVAMMGTLTSSLSLMQNHGTVHQELGRKYFITVHPAAALRFPKYKQMLVEDFKTLRSLL